MIDLRHGDCSILLPGIPDNSVDEVVMDPPYNAGKDYGEYKDDLPASEYEEWMRSIILECNRISRNGIVVYISGKLTRLFWGFMPEAHLIVVHKRAAGITCGNYQQQYHSILSTVKPVTKIKDLWDDIRLPGEGYFFREERFDNPGLTSLVLAERVIQSFTREGDTVLDPFSGTGTFGIGAIKLGRDFIGIEISQKQILIAQQRIAGIWTEGEQ